MLAENTAGEVDLQISPGTWTDRYALNSTQAKQILEQLGDDYSQMSPRVYTEVNAQFVKEPQNEFFGDFYQIYQEQEEHIQIGREWVYGKIPRGACIITESFAKQLKVKKDDEIQFMFSVANFTSIAADVIDQYAQRSMPLMMELLSAVPIKLIIYEVVDSVEKKWIQMMLYLWNMMNGGNMLQIIYPVHFMQPFQLRIGLNIYLTFDTEPLKKSLEKWASKIAYTLQFDELYIQMSVSSSLENFIVLVGISILLMYSLVMISVDTRTFEVGILRMVGLDRFGVVGVLIAQALLYSIPGWILVPLQKLMIALSIVIQTLIAFGISFIASILPIRQALSQNLHEFIDVTHTKASAIMVTIEKAEALQKPWGLLLSSIILTGIGVGVYFFMPQTQLSMNLISSQVKWR
ncbi:MAG: putative serine/threonine protein kinase [Streblomastix strix]|uniref:Putative serine/threonine protein kinase n=1 Tax=Streblomastix strix TaxID=222440 RepID=A0A5J4W501_9EUKA|nr:MAG: putative serine/threonine protein kinase [Streblomastix strix]